MTTTSEPDAEAAAPHVAATSGWRVVAEQECRDMWFSGRGPLLLFAYSLLLSVMTYLAGTNQVLNFLEQREAVSLTVQIAVAVGVLVTLVVSADSISGERERGTFENLLLSPASRRGIVLGKLLGALSLWFATFAISFPYLWALGRGVSLVGTAMAVGLAVGTILAVALACLGMLISTRSNSNRVSVAVGIFILLALFAPTQVPAGLPKAWFGDLLTRVNPIGSSLHYMSAVLVRGHSWSQDLSYLVSPALTAVLAGGLLALRAERFVTLRAERGRA